MSPKPHVVDLSPAPALDAVTGAPTPAVARGERLDRYLVTRAAEDDSPIGGLSRSRLQKLIEGGFVRIDGQPARASQKLDGSERIEVELPPPEPLNVVAEPIALDILHEDADIVVVVKSADMVVHPGAGRRSGTLVNALLAHCRDLSGIGGVARPGIVHRLDRGTSGVIVVAKTDRAHESLASQFARREVVKRYTAFVLGTPLPVEARITTHYGRHPTQRMRFTGRVSSGKEAITDYRVAAAAFGLAELDILLGTGRTHQIRVHLSERGHPIVGDALYGGRAYSRVNNAPLRALCSQLTHQALHARTLTFRQPSSNANMVFEAPLPADLAAIAAAIRHR